MNKKQTQQARAGTRRPAHRQEGDEVMVKDGMVMKLVAKGTPAGAFKRGGVKNVLIVWYVENQLHHLAVLLLPTPPTGGFGSKGITERECQELLTRTMADFLRKGVVERWETIEMETLRASLAEARERMPHIPALIGEFRKTFIKRVTNVAHTRALASMKWTLRTAKKNGPRELLPFLERYLALVLDVKDWTATVRASIERHRPGMLHELEWRCKELESLVRIDEPRKARLEQELVQLFTDRIQGLEKLVEDDLVRLLLGPEGAN